MTVLANIGARKMRDSGLIIGLRPDGSTHGSGYCRDVSEWNNRGELQNMSAGNLAAGPSGRGFAITMDGTDDVIEVPYSGSMAKVTTELSLCILYRPADTSTRVVAEKHNAAEAAQFDYEVWQESGKWNGRLKNQAGAYLYDGGLTQLIGGTQAANTWYLITLRGWISGSKMYLDLYQNLTQVDSDSMNATSLLVSTNDLDIGKHNATAYIKGRVGFMLVFNRKLDSSEIRRIYECGCLPRETGRTRRAKKRKAG